LLTFLLSAWQVHAIGFSDGFEGYAAGSLESNDGSGPNAGADGGANPWFGISALPIPQSPPSFVVVTNEYGVFPHSGTNMIRGHNYNALYNNDQEWYNLSFRCATGGVYYGNAALEWWFYDPYGAGGGGDYLEFVALCNYDGVAPDTDYYAWPTFGSQRLSLGAYIPGSGAGAPMYQARIVGATDGVNPDGWFYLTNATRSVGWHHARIVIGAASGAATPASFYIDNMITPALTHDVMIDTGFNLLEINGDYGNTTGYFDDFAFQDNVTAPAFTTGPTNLIVGTGASATFRVSGATGSPAPLYSWQRDGAPLTNSGRISGANTATLTITSCAATDTATYSCLVSNIAGVAVGTATLNVLIPPTIDSQSPVGGTFSAAGGDTVNLSVTAHASNPINYQWNKNASPLSNGGNISGATNAHLVITGFAVGDAGTYSCHLSNADGATDSTNVVLVLAVGPTINIQPTNRTVALGSTATFTVGAAGTSLSYQWMKGITALSNGVRVSGATSSALSISSVVDADAGSYSCVITNNLGSTNTASVTLTVIDPPVITTQPLSQVASNGSTVVLHVVATGTSPAYKWNKNGTPLSNGGDFSGVTTPDLTIHITSLADEGVYTVAVTNLAGSRTSTGAALRINQAVFSFFDDFESYATGGNDAGGRASGTALDYNYGNNLPANCPWWGSAPPNFFIYPSGEDGATAYSGNQMIGGAYTTVTGGDNDEGFLNLAYRFNGGQRYYGNVMLDWYFWDPGAADYGDQFALANFDSNMPSNADSTGFNMPGTTVQQLFLGAWPNLDTNKYQASIIGATDGTSGIFSKNISGTTKYFNTTALRSMGWHHARILVGPPDAGTHVANARFYVDDMMNTAFSHDLTAGHVGFNAIHTLACTVFNSASETAGFFDDVTFRAVNDPFIFEQPLSLTNDYGTTATFTVVAMATSYQWQKNSVIINGATNATLALTSVSLRDAGTYTCIVTGANGSVPSSAATLTVAGSPPYITSIVPSGANFIINFISSASDPASAFTVLYGSVVTGITNISTTAVITGSDGVYQATIPANGPRQFYRIQK